MEERRIGPERPITQNMELEPEVENEGVQWSQFMQQMKHQENQFMMQMMKQMQGHQQPSLVPHDATSGFFCEFY